MDCFSEKLYKDLEDRLTVKNKIIEGIERPNSTMFGDKKDNIKKFVIQCRNRLASSMEEINTLIENNQLMKIMTKRKEYFDLIKDTSTILMKLNALSKSTSKRTENEKVNASEKSNCIIIAMRTLKKLNMMTPYLSYHRTMMIKLPSLSKMTLE